MQEDYISRSQQKRLRNARLDMRPKASVKFVSISASKAGVILRQIKNCDVMYACALLDYSTHHASKVILKILKSAMANAENNLNLEPKKLFIEDAYAGRANILRRIRPRAKGRAYGIKKRFCHITLVLNEKTGG